MNWLEKLKYQTTDAFIGTLSLSTNWYKGKTKEEIAREVVGYYVYYVQKEYNPDFDYSVDDLMAIFSKEYGDKFSQLKSGVEAAEVWLKDMREGVRDVAKVYNKTAPPSFSSFINAISAQASGNEFYDVAIKTGEQVEHIAEIPKEIVKSAKNINEYFPYILGVVGIGVAAYFINSARRIVRDE
jgi:hypothetical protein